MVTAELAVTIPAVLLVLSLCLAGLRLGVDHLRCIDAARVGARELARAESPGRAMADARLVAPRGAVVQQSYRGELVEVTVRVDSPRTLRVLGVPPHLTCRSVARPEAAGQR